MTNIISNLKKKIAKYDIISFDIFDTLLLRPYVKPTDLFLHLENLENLKGFKSARIEAEEKARKNLSHYEDINFDEIYTQIDEKFKFCKNKELELEKQVLFCNPEIYEIYQEALKQKKRIIITSDMYLSYEDLTEILHKNNYKNYEKLYLSNDLRKTKHTGNIYPYILNDLKIKPHQILHIGDNKYADCKMAKKHKLNTFYYPQVIKRFKKISEKDKKIKKFIDSYNSAGASFLIMQMAIDFILNNKSWEKDYWQLIGKYYSGSLAYTYCNFIQKALNKNNLKEAVFVARDGYILEKVFNQLFCDIKTHYIYAPRKFSEISSLSFKKDNRNIPKFLEKRIKGHFNIVNASFNDLKDISNKHFQKFSKYINSFDIDNNFALVDTTTTFFSSQILFENINKKYNITGIYWCAYLLEDIKIDFKYEVYINNNDNNIIYWDIFEFLISAPEVPIIDLNDQFKPIFIKENKYENKRLSFYNDLINGAIDLSKSFKNTFQGSLPLFSSQDIKSLIDLFCLYPSKLDKQKWQDIYISRVSDHTIYNPLMIAKNPKKDLQKDGFGDITPPWNKRVKNGRFIKSSYFGIPYIFCFYKEKSKKLEGYSKDYKLIFLGISILNLRKTEKEKKLKFLYKTIMKKQMLKE